jgi:hypothetical protein
MTPDEIETTAAEYMNRAANAVSSTDTVYWVGQAQVLVSNALLKELAAIRRVLEAERK